VSWDQSRYGNQPLIFATAASLTGTVTYREKVALPPTAVIDVQLLDVSAQDSTAVLVGRRLLLSAGRQVPIPFELWYDPAAINSRNSYAVRARIFQGENLLFTTNMPVPVLTQGKPSANVEIVLTPASSSP
jgi:putative lipoprotein